MKKYFIYATMALFFATFVGCNEKNEEPRPNDPTTKSYDVSYKLNIATGKASDEGRKKIIDMVNTNLQPLGMSLAQMSESVWGASIPFGNDSVAARSFYNDLNSTLTVPYSQINVDNGILFYGYIEEIKKVDGDNHNYYNSHSEYITSPRPNKYRYVINRKTWDVKWFELPENANLAYDSYHTECYTQVVTDSGEMRNAYFNAQGVQIYKAGSNTQVEGTIVYHFNHNHEIQATLTTLEGSSVNMPITLEVRGE